MEYFSLFVYVCDYEREHDGRVAVCVQRELEQQKCKKEMSSLCLIDDFD